MKKDIDINEFIANLLGSATQDELVEFVKELNREIDDYDFTKEMRDYFVLEMEDNEDEELDYDEELWGWRSAVFIFSVPKVN